MGQIPLADMAYLKRRRGKGRSGYRWYVRYGVPPDLREFFGKKTIERALDTSDQKEAERRKHAVIANILESFAHARQKQITSADKAVQEVAAGRTHYGARFCAVVTNATFTPSAKQLAASTGALLIHFSELDELASRLGLD
jgi:hypothetical protein